MDESPKDQIENRKVLKVTLIVVAMVAVLWGSALCFPRSVALSERLNAVSTLFSGLAFVGIVSAIMLQREELGLQRQELRDTRAELARTATSQALGAEAMQKQVNQQFLTARLNAAIAHLQAVEARSSHPSSARSVFEETEWRGQLRRAHQSISILRCEANRGFNAIPWEPQTEIRAIRDYVIEMFHGYNARSLDATRTRGKPSVQLTTLIELAIEISFLSSSIRYRHPKAATAFDLVLANSPTAKEQSQSETNVEDVERWIQSAMATISDDANPNWQP